MHIDSLSTYAIAIYIYSLSHNLPQNMSGECQNGNVCICCRQEFLVMSILAGVVELYMSLHAMKFLQYFQFSWFTL